MAIRFRFSTSANLAKICDTSSPSNLLNGRHCFELGNAIQFLLQGNLCPGKTAKTKPRSCVDHLKNGANSCGYYKIYDAAGNGFTVYCDMQTEPGAAWTLLVSWSFKNKGFSHFRYNCPLSLRFLYHHRCFPRQVITIHK